MADELGTTNTILAIITAITGTGGVGVLLKQHLNNTKEVKLRKMELEDNVQDLTKQRDALLIEVSKLNDAHDVVCRKLDETTGDKRALQQKLATIHTAFNITYLHLKTKFPPDDPILAELKKHIDKGTGNIT